MLHATPTQRALAAVRDEFVPLARVIDLAQRIAERDEDDPEIAAYRDARDADCREPSGWVARARAGLLPAKDYTDGAA